MTKLLFDMYGVLMQHRSPEGREKLLDTVGVPMGGEQEQFFFKAFRELRPAYDAGLVSDEHWWQELAARTGLDFDIAAALGADFEGTLEADMDMVDYVRGLIAEGWTVGILSNIPTGLAQLVRARHEWLNDFAAVTFSCDIGVAKPDEQAYTVAVDALGATPKETFFIDDSAEYVAGAEKLGIRTHHFHGIEKLREEIEQL